MRMSDPALVSDIFASGLGKVDVLGGGASRLTFYAEHQLDDGSIEYRVAARIVVPTSSVPDAIMLATRASAVALMGRTEPAFN